MINIKKQAEIKQQAFESAKLTYKRLGYKIATRLVPASGNLNNYKDCSEAADSIQQFITEGLDFSDISIIKDPRDPMMKQPKRYPPRATCGVAEERSHLIEMFAYAEADSDLIPNNLNKYLEGLYGRISEFIVLMNSETGEVVAEA